MALGRGLGASEGRASSSEGSALGWSLRGVVGLRLAGWRAGGLLVLGGVGVGGGCAASWGSEAGGLASCGGVGVGSFGGAKKNLAPAREGVLGEGSKGQTSRAALVPWGRWRGAEVRRLDVSPPRERDRTA